MRKLTGVCIFCLAVTAQIVRADQTTVSMDSGSQTVFDQSTNPLFAGTSADGNGDVLQLGYYDAATVANNFAGNWVPMTGETSLNTAIIAGSSPAEPYNKTSIGDLTNQGGMTGTFFLPSLNFIQGSATSGNSLPPSPTIPLAIRFYNNTTIATSTFYNVVSDDLWVWKTPSTPSLNVALSLDDPNLEWLSIALGQAGTTAFHTTVATAVPVPEASTVICPLLTGAALAFHAIRRRIKR